jgi:N-acetyl-anhydromuramyl-L-alanine amidase AmpD
MSLVIDYDRPVEDYISALSKTGHVTHTSHKKTSVTFHHNGGNLTHAGILSVWRTRAASAHFDVDAHGKVAQFVKVTEYAWAVGDRSGNESSISIEMANSKGAPGWDVSDTTWKAAARLAGWLFAHVIKEKPTADNIHQHRDWSSTACPGPFMVKHWKSVISEVQKAYKEFADPKKDEKPSSGTHKTSVAEIASEVIAGEWGNGDDRVRRLRAAGYNPNDVQVEVNRQLSNHTHTAPRKSVNTIAHEVIAGKWGNGDTRKARLTKAGYDYSKIQKEVNSILS